MANCVGLYLRDGLVMLSDTRTNAGVDNIAVFSTTHIFQIADERCMVLMMR